MIPIISRYPFKFGGHKARGSLDIYIFFCHVTLCDHIIKSLCDFSDNSLSSEATVQSRLEAIGLAELESLKYNIFSFVAWSLITWSVSQSLVDCGSLLWIATVSWGNIPLFICPVTSGVRVIKGSADFVAGGLPSLVTTSLGRREWSILILTWALCPYSWWTIRMIILLQSVTIQFRRTFDIFHITKRNKEILLESVTGCYDKAHQVLQSVTDFITKHFRYYKVRLISLHRISPGNSKNTNHDKFHWLKMVN